MVSLLTGCVHQAQVTKGQEPAAKTSSRAAIESQAGIRQDNAENSIAGLTKTAQPPPFKLIEISTQSSVAQQPANLAEFWQARGEVGEPGGTLTVGAFGQGPKTFNAWVAADEESDGLGQLMWESLIDLDPWTGEYYPRLARSITVSADKKTVTIVLRKGLLWSDGKPIDADDVVFTLNSIIGKGYGNASARDDLSVNGQFPKVERVDNLTVKLHLAQPFAPILEGLRVPVAPKHILEPLTKGPAGEFNKSWGVNCDPSTLVVSGPFKISRYLPAQRIEMVRNPYYAFIDKKGQRLPYLNRFNVIIVPDQNTEILKFYGNEIDFLDIRAVRGLDAAQMKSRESEGHFKIYNLGPDDGTMFLMFNMNRRKKENKFFVDVVKQKWFNNLNFRLAVSHAVNRKSIINNVLRGVGMPLYTAESPASLYFDKSLKPFPQDLKLATQLLAKGGFIKRDDILYDADGHKVEFTLTTNAGNSTRDGACVMIKNELEKLGMTVNYQPIDFNILVDKAEHSCDWEAIVMGLTGSKIEPYKGASVWKSDGRLHMFDQRLPNKNEKIVVDDARDWEKELDDCFNKGATTFDTAARHVYFDKYQKIAFEQQPFIFLYSTLDLTAMRDTVGNYRPTPLGVLYSPKGSLHNIEEIYIKKNHLQKNEEHKR